MTGEFELFDLPKRAKNKLKNADKIKKELAKGVSLCEILEIADGDMHKFYQAAYKLLDGKRYVDAGNAFLFLVTLNPYSHDYWLGLGMAAQFCHDYEAAIDAYEMASMNEIESPIPYFYLAKCLFALHDRQATEMALDLSLDYAKGKAEHADLRRQIAAAKKLLKNMH